jgi:hypothetical protein
MPGSPRAEWQATSPTCSAHVPAKGLCPILMRCAGLHHPRFSYIHRSCKAPPCATLLTQNTLNAVSMVMECLVEQ